MLERGSPREPCAKLDSSTDPRTSETARLIIQRQLFRTVRPMAGLPDDPAALVPQGLNAEDSVEYERRTVRALRDVLLNNEGGLLEIDEIELIGSPPDTLVVFRYHHRDEYVGRHPSVVAGVRAEIVRLWDFAIDENEGYSQGSMDPPAVLAAAIGSAFDAAELSLVDPHTLAPIGRPPNIFPRRYDIKRPLSD